MIRLALTQSAGAEAFRRWILVLGAGARAARLAALADEPGSGLEIVGFVAMSGAEKTVASEYLTADQWARLDALGTAHEEDYARQSFLMTSFQMLRKELRFNRDTADEPSDVVSKAADKADVPTTRAATLRGEDIIDNLADAPPAAHIPCLNAAMDAVEAGPDIVEKRAADWRRYDIPSVMANPLESALGQCWPWADETLGSELRTIWVDTIAEVAADKGTTLAVVPLRVLAESGGVLDQLDARGFDIAGPEWK